jgi:small conductance mechanosensitive channel
MTNHLETIEQLRQIVVERSTEFLPKFLIAIVIVVVGVLLGRLAARGLERLLSRFELDLILRSFISRLARTLVLGLFLILALQNLGVQLLPLVAGLGVAGAGIALAMQGVLGNVVAGLTIVFTRPFHIGEYVSMVGEEGRVDQIALFTTTLSHPDLSRVVIPNRKIVGEVLHNYGEIRQVEVIASVSYDTDLNHALAVIRQTVDANPRTLKHPTPVVLVKEMGDYTVEIAVKPWVKVDDFVLTHGELYQQILEAFDAHNIQVPFPQHEVRLLGQEAR